MKISSPLVRTVPRQEKEFYLFFETGLFYIGPASYPPAFMRPLPPLLSRIAEKIIQLPIDAETPWAVSNSLSLCMCSSPGADPCEYL